MASNQISINFVANDQVTGEIKDIVQGLGTLLTIAGGVALAVSKLDKEMDNLAKTAKKSPELFDARQIKDIQDYQKSTEELSNSFAKLKANTIAPVMASIARGLVVNTKFSQEYALVIAGLERQLRQGKISSSEYEEEMIKLGVAQQDLSTFTGATTGDIEAWNGALENSIEQTNFLNEAMMSVGDARLQFIDITQQMQEIENEFVETQEELTAKRVDLELQLEDASGKKREKIIADLEAVDAAMKANVENQKTSTNQMVADYALSVFKMGNFTPAEFRAFQDLQVELGLVDEVTADAASALVDGLAPALNDVSDVKLTEVHTELKEGVEQSKAWASRVASIINQVRRLDGMQATVDIFINTQGGIPSGGSFGFGGGGGSVTASAATLRRNSRGASRGGRKGRQHGGPVRGGSIHEVTEGGAPEMLNIGNKQFLMMPQGKQGQVDPMKSGGSSGSSNDAILATLESLPRDISKAIVSEMAKRG